MYELSKKNYGYHITFKGVVSADEMKKWSEESAQQLASAKGDFSVFVDMRDMSPLDNTASQILRDGQKQYKDKGMTRSVVVVAKGFIATHLKLLAKNSGIYQWERYVDASAGPDWEQRALGWVEQGKDPDAA